MTNRYWKYWLALAVLAASNVWHWYRPAASPAAHTVRGHSLAPEDLVLHLAPQPRTGPATTRDLFFAKEAPIVERAAKPPPAPSGPPPKTPEELAAEAAEAAFARLSVTGIAFRGGVGQAYLTTDGESYVVKVGDKVADRFEVRAIAAEYVSLHDTQTQLDKQVALQGG